MKKKECREAGSTSYINFAIIRANLYSPVRSATQSLGIPLRLPSGSGRI